MFVVLKTRNTKIMIKANNPSLKTWVEVPENSDFPIQNIPSV